MLFRVYSRYVPNLTRRDGSAFERLITQSIASQALPVETLKENCDV
jgi:integrase